MYIVAPHHVIEVAKASTHLSRAASHAVMIMDTDDDETLRFRVGDVK